MPTAYHSKYWANALTLRAPSDSVDKLTQSIANARVDLNPHQVDAALFAFRSLLSKGAVLADEVGLGKTIEAGIVISQRWAERRRRVLLIVPATLRKQWQEELASKFYLPTRILESATFNRMKRGGNPNPFDTSAEVCGDKVRPPPRRTGTVSFYTWQMRLPSSYDTARRDGSPFTTLNTHGP